jgi:hypothetical protein
VDLSLLLKAADMYLGRVERLQDARMPVKRSVGVLKLAKIDKISAPGPQPQANGLTAWKFSPKNLSEQTRPDVVS